VKHEISLDNGEAVISQKYRLLEKVIVILYSRQFPHAAVSFVTQYRVIGNDTV
jgi:hypothetical protein